MSDLTPIPWTTQSTEAQSGVVSCERMVNCYLEANPQNSKGPVAIYGDAGLNPWITVGSGPIRGSLLFGSLLFVVSGVELYSVNSGGTAVLVGTVNGTGVTPMIANSTQIGIATNAGWYVYSSATGLVTLINANVYTSATYQDGYGILSLTGTEQFYITAVDDFATIAALDFTSADVFADDLVAVVSDHRELLALGADTIQGYYNSGDTSFPFSQTPGGFVETGCAAALSVAKMSNRVFWLGNDLGVWSMSGWQPQKISTPGIERAIRELQYPEQAVAFTYRLQGHENYVLTFPERCFVFDLTTGLWRERETFGASTWRAQGYARAFGLDIVGDRNTNQLYKMELNYYQDNGSTMRRLMRSAPIHGGGRLMMMHELRFDCEMGGAPSTVEDPMAMLCWSDNGGRTWENERQISAGKIGEYAKQMRETRLGSFRQRTIELSITDPIPVAIVGAYARLEACDT